jgi:hypothetical protein
MNPNACFLASLTAISALAAGTALQAAQPLNIENLETMSATVEAVDVQTRMLSLRGTEGRMETLEVSPEVSNLPQVKVGDKLMVRYYQSMAATIKAKDTSTTLSSVDHEAAESRAQPGEKPGAMVGRKVTSTVVIHSVDKKNNSVMFSGPDGLVRSVPIKRPEAQKFVKTLKQGDQVELTYTEALAVSIEGAK